MKKIVFAAKGWKTLQKDYISRDLHAVHLQKLHGFLQQDVSGCSFEEMTIHYGFISHAAAQTSIAAYMQTGTFENAESYFYLAARAKETSDQLWAANPHKQAQQGQEVPMDCLLTAILSGCTSSAVSMLEKIRATLEHEEHRSDRSRKDFRQNEDRKKRISLEIDFYKSLLQSSYEQAGTLLSELNGLLHDTPMLQVMYAFLEQDDGRFSEAIVQHMKSFRDTPYPMELNYFVLVMEALYRKRKDYDPLDFADAPALLLKLPECSPMTVEEKIGVHLPSFDISELLKAIDKNKIGPMFQQY